LEVVMDIERLAREAGADVGQTYFEMRGEDVAERFAVAVRREALEEAARLGDEIGFDFVTGDEIALAIRAIIGREPS
jgi:DhnA family fructose-bisphosphate aldolase class Ia